MEQLNGIQSVSYLSHGGKVCPLRHAAQFLFFSAKEVRNIICTLDYRQNRTGAVEMFPIAFKILQDDAGG